MARQTLIGLIASLAVALTGCGGSEGGNDAVAGKVSDSTTTSAASTADHQSAGQALLRLADFPAGWRESAGQEGNEKVRDCPAFTALRKVITAEVDSQEFSKGEQTGVANTLTLWSTAADADAYLTAWQDPSLAGCVKEMIARNVRTLEKDPEAGEFELISVDVGNLSVRPTGDRSVGIQVTGKVKVGDAAYDFYRDFVMVQVGRATAQFAFADALSPMGEPREALVDAVVARMHSIE